MQKFLRRIIIMTVIVCIYLLIKKETNRLSPKTVDQQTGIVSTGVDLSNCVSYFDGCNNCSVKDGKPDACTLMYCEKPTEPKCLQYATGADNGNPPTDWKVYQNEKFQFTFSYPSDWILSQGDASAETYSLLSIGMGKTPEIYGDLTAWVNVVDESEISKAIQAFIKNYVDGTIITKEQKIVVGGMEGKLIYVNVGGDSNRLSRRIFVSYNSNTYIIGITFDVDPFDKQFDQIVSTFKFTK